MNTQILPFIDENGCLNISKIRELPLDEQMNVMTYMTQKQTEEYWSRFPINESQSTPITISGRYKMKERGVDAFDFLEKMRKKYGY